MAYIIGCQVLLVMAMKKLSMLCRDGLHHLHFKKVQVVMRVIDPFQLVYFVIIVAVVVNHIVLYIHHKEDHF